MKEEFNRISSSTLPLSPVTFDHVDVSRLLKDLTYLKNEIQMIRLDTVSKMEMSSFESKMHKEIAELRKCICQNNSATSPQLRHSPPTNRTSESSNLLSTITYKSISDKPQPSAARSNKPVANTPPPRVSCPLPVTPLTFAPDLCAPLTPTYRDIIVSQPVVQMSDSSNDRADKDGFKLVEKKKRSKQRNMRGTLSNNVASIEAIEPQCAIYVSRTKKDVKELDIENHIRAMGEDCLKVEILKQHIETLFNSFKVTIKSCKITKFLDSNFWPNGIVYRRYRERAYTDKACNTHKNG